MAVVERGQAACPRSQGRPGSTIARCGPPYSLRKRWNQVKGEAAPWWAENSKEAYAGGIAGAVTALRNWHGSRTGKRAGPKVRFPRLKKRTTDRLRCTYTTGALRVEGSRTVVLPGPALSGRRRTSGRCGGTLAADRPDHGGHHRGESRAVGGVAAGADHRTAPPEPRPGVVGVDAGIGNNLLIVMRPDGAIAEKVPNPRALRASLADLRRANQALSRKSEGSSRWRKAKRKLACTRHGLRTSVPTRSIKPRPASPKPTARWSSGSRGTASRPRYPLAPQVLGGRGGRGDTPPAHLQGGLVRL